MYSKVFFLISEDFDYLKKYLCEFALPERSCTILDWSNGGQVYLDYINMNEMVKGVLGVGLIKLFIIKGLKFLCLNDMFQLHYSFGKKKKGVIWFI